MNEKCCGECIYGILFKFLSSEDEKVGRLAGWNVVYSTRSRSFRQLRFELMDGREGLMDLFC